MAVSDELIEQNSCTDESQEMSDNTVKVKKKKKRKKRRKNRKIRSDKKLITKRPDTIPTRIKKAFDRVTGDLSCITNTPAILRMHLRLLARINATKTLPYVVPSGPNQGKSPVYFGIFKNKYPEIYSWWIHIIRSCLDKEYKFYRFFGGKGITISHLFLDARKFCAWALKSGLTHKPFTYKMFLIRKNKSSGFTPWNMRVTSENEIHKCNSLYQALDSLRLIKEYEAHHDPSVSYLTFYTRYYMYDLDLEDALNMKYIPSYSNINNVNSLGFNYKKFYAAVATEESCSLSTFKSRIHYSYLNGGFKVRPYEMLKPEFSVTAEANLQGTMSYKQLYWREQKEKMKQTNPYTADKELIQPTSIAEMDDVYSYDDDIYTPIGEQ